MYNGFIFDKKCVFYILTAFSSFTENRSINFEHKNFKSLIMLSNISFYWNNSVFLNLIDDFIIVLQAKCLVCKSIPPCFKRAVPQVVGNYTMKLENAFRISYLIFYTFGHDSVCIENWREVVHDTQSAQIPQK